MGSSVLDHLAQAAAVIVLFELLVVVMIFAGVAGGLVFGLRWVGGKTGMAFGKTNDIAAFGAKYIRLGADYASKPFLLLGRASAVAEGTAGAVRREARFLHESRPDGARPETAPELAAVEASAVPAETVAAAPSAEPVDLV